MLAFTEDQVKPFAVKSMVRCSVCGERPSTWSMALIGELDASPVCGWCAMYSGTQWGHDNRDELLHVGRACVGMAAQHDKPIPHLDERGRLSPQDAERYMMGIAFTSRMFGA